MIQLFKTTIEQSSVEPSTLRHLWSLIEEMQASILLNLNDTDLIDYLLDQLKIKNSIEIEEVEVVKNYLKSKTLLIRDIAEFKI
jgi:anionic cell wall polymer biosynthesis LytR-Cps2A-Psr (LCP) family protein